MIPLLEVNYKLLAGFLALSDKKYQGINQPFPQYKLCQNCSLPPFNHNISIYCISNVSVLKNKDYRVNYYHSAICEILNPVMLSANSAVLSVHVLRKNAPVELTNGNSV